MNLFVKYDDLRKVLASILGIELLLTGTAFILGITLRKQLADLLGISSPLVCCLFINFISSAGFQAWSIYKRYIYDYKTLIITTLIISVGTTFSSILAVVYISHSAISRAVSISCVSASVAFCIYFSIFFKEKIFYKKEIWSFALLFSIPLLPHYLAEFVLQSSDKLMINYLCGSKDVAIYSIAYAVGSLINLFGNSVSATFNPYLFQKLKSKEYEKLTLRANQALLVIGIILCGIMLFSREIVLIFGGNKYLESIEVIIPICLGVFFNYLYSFFAQIQIFYEKKRMIIIPSIMCALLNIILNYIFIKIFGYKAAAYTTFISYLIFCVIAYFLYRKTSKELLEGKKIYNTKGILLISLGIILAGIFISYLNTIVYLKYIILAIGLIIFILKKDYILEIIKCLFITKK